MSSDPEPQAGSQMVSPFFGASYNLPAPDQAAQYITRITTPGQAQAISIYNGRAYVADGSSGLQVINYLAYDSGTISPTITISNNLAMTSPTNGVVEVGKLVRVTANVTDGNFPFEHRFVSPRMTTTKTNFTVRAKATDTGGNFTWSDEILVDLTPDITPPILLRTDPPDGTVVTNANAVFTYFNEVMDSASFNAATFNLTWAGPDFRLGTAADEILTDAEIGYRETLNAGVLSFSGTLPFGVYRLTVTTGVTDAAGNALVTNTVANFAILANGPDGDDDGDGLTNAQELLLGLNPENADTDGDGWSDQDEVDNGTDGTNPNSRPQLLILAGPPVRVFLPSPDTDGTAGAPVFLAKPPVQIDLPSPESNGTSGVGVIVARPPVQIDLPSPDTAGVSSPGLYLAQPPVSVFVTNNATAGP